ncbi:MAG TPA: dihydrofolate reductase, partial [Lactobacillus acetotolerans]|nr:dihydrofolate reductase [Lactobacillus acetotolerans]
VSRKVIENSKSLKLIACTRSNPVNIDVEAAKEFEIKVVYTPGRNSDATAEFAVALLLDIAR